MKFCSADSIRVRISVALRYYFCSDKECVVVSWLSEYHTEPTVFMVRPVRSMRTGPYGQCVRSPQNHGCFFFAGIADMLILRMLKTI